MAVLQGWGQNLPPCVCYQKTPCGIGLRLFTHVGFFRKRGLIFSEVFWYMERSKNFEKEYFLTVQKIHFSERV